MNTHAQQKKKKKTSKTGKEEVNRVCSVKPIRRGNWKIHGSKEQ